MNDVLSVDVVVYYVYPLSHEAEKVLLNSKQPPYCLTAEPIKTQIRILGQTMTVYQLVEADFCAFKDRSTTRDYHFFQSVGGVMRHVIKMRSTA